MQKPSVRLSPQRHTRPATQQRVHVTGKAGPAVAWGLTMLVLALTGRVQTVIAAPSPQNDPDGDLVVNTADVDDDNDGIPDLHEIAMDGSDQDSDGDGMPDRLDLDSDNDGIPDWLESGATKTLSLATLRVTGARLSGEVGVNGLLDVFEWPVDTGNMAYALANTDVNEDALPDFLDLDSDNDGWPDIREIGVLPAYDSDGDARVDAPPGTVGNDGIADFLQRVNDLSCCDLNGDGADDLIPINTDSGDLPDFQDLDSDNDGLNDIVELGGSDADNDGHVDNFIDVAGGPDGTDDGLLAFPYTPRDLNGNAVYDHVEFVPTSNPDPVPSDDAAGEDPVGMQPQPDGETVTPPLDDELPGTEPEGVVRTGLGAAGCSIASKGFDPFLFLSIIISAIMLIRRFKPGRGQANEKRTN